MAGNREFFFRKLHSLLGVIPVGLFIIVHLGVNYFATYGPDSYNQATHFMESLPFRYVLEIFVIFLPILFHAIYGLYIAFQAKHNTSTYSYFRNWMFRLQRWTGVFTVIFIAWHVWETRIAAALGAEVNFAMMANIVANPYILAFYIVGIVATTFHFANGLWSFFVSWGITITPRSQLISSYVTLGVFVALTFVGVRAILAFI
ncbi:succinate dehydrogenase cytochrome b558 subunit [Anaerobacillus isosaccharinicus]|uniref:Succinate dehydrogenase n=1 Tax=Anaerobacillus isosaccharinicus TaxID=1532552 RepID=A0A1S2MH33_9BACI|nr:succinate dehydrogenase cytochrome b558 subunit [Anaerobacillus isosaccharinicus]MBA5587873.1 succinate dehydrogenase cytochrome b558 subunit [Anaerobacillus isosaccharinicus]QOY33973.1 succinate dehydrogenase cytochrome b558 subunit [Anaerobacillus isosaccharinicus]